MVKGTVKANVYVEIVQIDNEDKLRDPPLTEEELIEMIKESVNYGDDFTTVIVKDVKLEIESI